MGFEFAKKPMIEISGKMYECDPSNSDLIQGVIHDFPKIVSSGQTIDRYQKELKSAISKMDSAKIDELGKEIEQENARLLEHCKSFIQGCLGTKEYEEIFLGRKPNSAEHLDLCTYIFEQIMEGRQKVLEEYLDPPKKDAAE